MLRAVIIGWAQPRRSHLLRRRWMRRLLFRSFRRMMVFTRNPFVHPVLEKADTPINTGKTEGFRVFHEFLPANARNFACLGTRLIFRTLTGVTNVGSGSSFSLEPLVGKSCRSSGAEMPFLRHCRHRPDRSRLPLIGTSIGFS